MAKKKAAKAAATDEPKLKPLNICNDLGGGRFSVSLDQLGIGKTNMRHGHVPDKSLIASLQHHGQLNDLIVRTPSESVVPWKWEIVDGGRRYVSAVHGVVHGLLPEDFRMNVRVDEAAGKEISVAANLHQAAHPLDTCEAILELAKTEDDETAIAAHFGQSVVWVKQRAKLASLTDKAKQAYRDGRMDLDVAGLMTRLDAKEQDRVCKGKDRLYRNDILGIIAGKGVDASIALFDWKAEYPKDKVQGSLFDDVNWLLDRKLFKQHQDKAATTLFEQRKAEGFNVLAIDSQDYSTEYKYVEFKGTVTDKNRGSLYWLFRPTGDVSWKILGPMVARKDAEGVKKNKGKADETTAEPKPMKADELSFAQVEILRAHVWNHRLRAMADGKVPEREMLWAATVKLLSEAKRHNGPIDRWRKLEESYPGELEAYDFGEIEDLTEEKFLKLNDQKRRQLFCKVVAATLFVPYGADRKELKAEHAAFKVGRLQPGEAFFKRYRMDQLLDYFKRAKYGAIETVRGQKKGFAVGLATKFAKEKDGFHWQFGLDK